MPSDTLILRDVVKSFGDTSILRGVSLEVNPGETVAVVGPSGSGKSTLLNIVGSLDKPTSGSVTLGDTDVAALTDGALVEYRSKRIGFVFQDHFLLPQLTALENVLLPTLALPRNSARADQETARLLLSKVGVDYRSEAFPATMSGGERQRVAVARALVNEPGLLLCDEPTGNLDGATGSSVIDLLLKLASTTDVAVIMVTHNREHASRFARCLRLQNGLLANEEVQG